MQTPKSDPRPVVIAGYAVGIALLASVWPESVSISFLAWCAASAALCGFPALYAEHPVPSLCAASMPVAFVAYEGFIGYTRDVPTKAAAILLLGAALAALFGLPAYIARRAGQESSLVLLVVALWIGALAGGTMAVAGATVRRDGSPVVCLMGDGRLPSIATCLAFLLGALFAAVALRRDAARTRSLRLRVALGAVLVMGEGAAAVTIAAAYWTHRRPLTGIVSVALDETHACALRGDGGVECWGLNEEGELGDGTASHRYSPVRVAGLHDVVEITPTCARRSSGEVLCWGGSDPSLWRPHSVPGLPLVRALAREGVARQNCALAEGGDFLCWDGCLEPRTHLAKSSDALGLVADNLGGCVRGPDHLDCGWRTYPSLPRALCTLPEGSPAPLAGSLVADVAGVRICEVTTAGRVRCWHRPLAGLPCSAAFELVGIENARRVIFEGSVHAFTLDPDGVVRSWHEGGFGKQRHWLQDPAILDEVVDLAGALRSFCAVRRDGSVWCWGSSNEWGQLGDRTREPHDLPAPVQR